MGPLKLLRNNADGVEWAHESYREVPAMVLDGPTKATEKCCQWSRMGLPILLRNAANGLGWAHQCYKDCLLPQMGPAKLWRNIADGLKWAHLSY